MKLVICIPNSNGHYTEAGIGFMSVYDVTSKSTEFYPIELSDIGNVQYPEIKDDCIVYNKKLFDVYYPTVKSYDLETQLWLNGISFDIDSLYFGAFREHYRVVDYYKYVPYYKYVKACEDLISKIISLDSLFEIDTASKFYSYIVYPSIQAIERNGMYVDITNFNNTFNKKYTKNYINVLYSIHTKTGRPSNTFDGVNYSALNKKDDSRKNFVSRYTNGFLVEYDFDSYHLRLIAKILEYDFSNIESIHNYFGKMYFKTDTLTEDQYEESKKLSFKLLYKDDEDLCRSYNIDFFNKVSTLKKKVWEDFKTNKYISSHISKRKLHIDDEDMNKSKLFSYYIQMLETEISMLFIYDVNRLLEYKKSKIILYTYDSFLIDYNLEDGYDLLKDIKHLLINSKVKKGNNYKEMELFSV
jgi:hypothetical protein